MTTINAVNNGLAGATGTGNFVGANTPTLITPNLGVATATSLIFNPTTNGIIGTTTNNNAVAGSVGQFIDSGVVSGTYATTTTFQNATSISLTAGDWDVYGNVWCVSTTIYTLSTESGISATSVSGAIQGSTASNGFAIAGSALGLGTVTMPLYTRVSLAITTIIYLTTQAVFTSTAPTFFCQISARRVR